LIDFFHGIYNDTYRIKSTVLKACKVPAIIRLVILSLANTIIPLFLRFYKIVTLPKSGVVNIAPVVTLTSFPQRIDKIHLVIESLLRQTIQPSRIILWLSEEQFSSLSELPDRLLKLQDRGLEIILTPGDLRSYKKYYFYLKDNVSKPFIIVDDDIFYPSYLIESLVKTAKNNSNSVCANRCTEIDGNERYKDWLSVRGESVGPQLNLLPTGCGGVLYPANSLHQDALNESLFTELCKDADDIWLSCMAYLNNVPTVYTGKNEYFLPVNSIGNLHLHTGNVSGSNNDKCIAKVKDYYSSKLGLDVFDR
jgi:hypothetical protein